MILLVLLPVTTLPPLAAQPIGGAGSQRPGRWPSSPPRDQRRYAAPVTPFPQQPYAPPAAAPQPAAVTAQPVGRRVRFFPRSSIPIQAQSFPSPDGSEQIWIIDSGVVVRIDGVDPEGPVEVATDRLVVWTSPVDQLDLSGGSLQQPDTPLEFYMEGNIVFRQGQRVVYARSMYYDVRTNNGIVLEAEMLTPVQQYEGLLRVKADVLRQIDRQQFVVHGAAITSSRLGVPRYWFQTETATLQDLQLPTGDPLWGFAMTGPAPDPIAADREILVSSRNNLIYVGGIPIFYWPILTTDLTKPSLYLERLSVRNDRVFGTQVLTDWDTFQLLGIQNPPRGTEWTTSLDYLADRGFGGGTNLFYDGQSFFGTPGPVGGEWDAWMINDTGLDDLGRDRRALSPEQEFRGRLFGRHRQRLDNGFQLTAEVGLISDRNFLEQYYENEWDELKDQTTGVQLKRILGNKSWSAAADVRPNDFFTQTQWLPRLDHFQFSQALLQEHFTWMEHSHVGFADLRTAELSSDPADPSVPLDWERDPSGVPYASRSGLRAATRQELDLPFSLGPVKVVPYVLGEVARWGEDRDGEDVTRAFGQAGIRASLPMWRVDPTVEDLLLDLHGLTHKIVFDTELYWADANRDLDRFPLYDPLDDDAEEAFRRRFFIPGGTFFGMPPNVIAKFDERRFALRSGMQSWVTGPTEIADDLLIWRVAARQRWQTKRGLPGSERIVDWITLDVGASLFPKPGRDNFGSDLGPLNYDFRWHLGDRVTLLSDGYMDFFSEGLRTVSIGSFLTRPGKTSAYFGLRSIEGPISSNIVTSALSYRLSPKWITTSGSSFDFGETGNIGQSYEITRIGESFLTSISVKYDRGRDNLSVGLAVEPRFLVTSRRGRIGGVPLPALGSFGLE